MPVAERQRESGSSMCTRSSNPGLPYNRPDTGPVPGRESGLT
jgi:hypothetical protein